MSVTVHTQAELDQALADRADVIYIESDPGVWLRLADSASARVVALGSARVEAHSSAHVEAWDSAHVEAWGSAHVEAHSSAHVEAWDSAHVEAWGSAHVEAYASAHVEAHSSARVVAYGSAHVEAWGSAHVKAGKYVAVHLHSQRVTLDAQGAVIDMTALDLTDPATWCDYHGVLVADGIAYLYKAVNQQWTTDRGVDYSPGSTPEAPDWGPNWRDCGKGLHFCAHPMMSLIYLGLPADEARFLQVGVRLDELVPLDDKAKARRVVVPCIEVDRYGEIIDQEVSAS
ncbi:hypothetical protein SEA_SKINNYPETE_38 [Mycobacterium phage SkinnyPete]|uniref:DUF7666 domain-containing protein n=1 Tax=Mycobacterium phage SkinnyPete TaxID=1821539 RepID=A0A142UM61_9CAUD|nr:hypothetical protein FDG99_gp38 [Mycobacterium phage SkinnyPete]AMU78468.1 hypothetical protein SEA_SKINNYPETE_38 [Mycobacterium phage SkinnyPete]